MLIGEEKRESCKMHESESNKGHNAMSRIFVTGGSGFVGKQLCRELLRQGLAVRIALRKKAGAHFPPAAEMVEVGDITADTDWKAALSGIDVVMHLAARVHVMEDASADPLAEFRKVNVQGTENLARQAARAGVKRLVYVSSIGVNGLLTSSGVSFSEVDEPNPHNEYAQSKWEAEQALHRIARETGLEVVILRPPLVYGRGAPGNFAQMLKVLAKGIPLPLASVHNLRSFVYVGNLVDALILCASHPAAVGKTYLVSDGEDVSTSDLLSRLGVALGRPARLFPFPASLLTLAARMTGRGDQIERLLGSLRLDSSKIRRELGWQPPYSLSEGLRLTAESRGGEKQ